MKLNGKEYSLKTGMTIYDLLTELNLSVDKVVFEVDGVIIQKDKYVNQILKNSNVVEVISFVGGGWYYLWKFYWMKKNI